MPCRCDDFDTKVPSELDSAKSKIESLKKELDRVTRFLCEILSNYDVKLTEEQSVWWQNHQISDKKRKLADLQRQCGELGKVIKQITNLGGIASHEQNQRKDASSKEIAEIKSELKNENSNKTKSI